MQRVKVTRCQEMGEYEFPVYEDKYGNHWVKSFLEPGNAPEVCEFCTTSKIKPGVHGIFCIETGDWIHQYCWKKHIRISRKAT